MKVLLTAPPKYLLSGDVKNIDSKTLKTDYMPPLAVYLLASILRENGHTIKILDPINNKVKLNNAKHPDIIEIPTHHFAESYNAHIQFPNLEKQILDVDIVSISSTSPDWFLAKAMSERIKFVDPDIPIIAGGVHATFANEYILQNSKVDYVVRGEGEKILPELLDAIENNRNLKDILGITYKNNGNITCNNDRPNLKISELENMPLPAFDLMPSNIYTIINVESSRGCKFSCVFCSIPFKKYWRGLSPEVFQKRVEHALDYAKKLFGNKKAIFFADDTFTADINRAEQILHNFGETDFGDVHLSFDTRANDLINSNIMELSKKIPLDHILIGVESGYDEGLKNIRKGTTTKNIEKCASIAKQHGICLWHSFIIGFPWESKEDCMKTIDFAYNIVSKYNGQAFINWFHLFPGSYLWNNRESYGIHDGLEIFDSLYPESKDFRFKVSSKLSECDIINIKNRIKQHQFLLFLKPHNDFITDVTPYCNGIKIVKFG